MWGIEKRADGGLNIIDIITKSIFQKNIYTLKSM